MNKIASKIPAVERLPGKPGPMRLVLITLVTAAVVGAGGYFFLGWGKGDAGGEDDKKNLVEVKTGPAKITVLATRHDQTTTRSKNLSQADRAPQAAICQTRGHRQKGPAIGHHG